MKKMVIAISGATGVIYGIKLLEQLKKLNIETHLIISKWGKKTISIETRYSLKEILGLSSYSYDENDLGACVSSGSFSHSGMAIVPCTMKTLAAISSGISLNLIHRSADVTIKENRKLLLAVRETPMSSIHIENMLKLSKMDVIIMPPVPAFYYKPVTIEEIVNAFVGRILDQFDIGHDLYKGWGEINTLL